MNWFAPYETSRVQAVVGTAATTLSPVTVTASATPHTKGSWSEIVASTDRESFVLALVFENSANNATDTGMLLDIGIGAAGSEVVVISNLLVGFVDRLNLILPFPIPAGVRVAARCQSVTASRTITVGARFYGGHRIGPRPWSGPITTYGVATGTTRGISPATPGAANTKGAWTQIVASTSRPHKGLLLMAQGTSTNMQNRSYLIDIGIGAASSEVVIVPDLFCTTTAQELAVGPLPPVIWLERSIPSGSRLSIRCQTDATSNMSIECAIYGLG